MIEENHIIEINGNDSSLIKWAKKRWNDQLRDNFDLRRFGIQVIDDGILENLGIEVIKK